MSTNDERYSVVHLDEIERLYGGRMIPVRAHLGIEAFGVTAWTAGRGGQLINDHDEKDSEHQELYVVVTGRATFTVAGKEIDAPAGALVFVGEPGTQRTAFAAEPDTTLLAIGAKPGEAYRPVGWEFSSESIQFFESGEYERAYELLARANEQQPDQAGVLYNLACAEARLGKTDEALAHLERAVALSDRFREYAKEDPDLESIRSHPAFVAT